MSKCPAWQSGNYSLQGAFSDGHCGLPAYITAPRQTCLTLIMDASGSLVTTVKGQLDSSEAMTACAAADVLMSWWPQTGLAAAGV